MTAGHVLKVDHLPPDALTAGRQFWAQSSDHIAAVLAQRQAEDGLVIALPHAEYDHRDWRLAMARDLARKYAPARVNIIGGGNDRTIAEVAQYLHQAAGVTGQYFALASGQGGDEMAETPAGASADISAGNNEQLGRLE